MKLEASDIRDLRPVINEVVRSTLAMIDRSTDRIGVTEPEAAALLGVPRHVLGDARRRGEITAKRIGKRYVYSRRVLQTWLEESS